MADLPFPTDFEPPTRLFTDTQLARLLEISSNVECECPNHVAKIVSSLVHFEEYSKTCLMESSDDREIHELLWRETSKARGIMEAALERLNEFEDIEV